MKKVIVILIVVLLILIGFGGYFAYQYYNKQLNPVACTMEAKICPDGSAVGRAGPDCEFAACPQVSGIVYQNNIYGFSIILPESWRGYSVATQTWQGWVVGDGEPRNMGLELIIKNPKTTAQQQWQDIPIMIIAPNVWQLITEEKVAVSAAPIGPAKIGENSKYIFATPPRWYGFTDAVGSDQAVEAVKTFRAF